MRITRNDRELMNLNFKPVQFRVLVHGILHTLERDGDEMATTAMGAGSRSTAARYRTHSA